MDTPAAATPKPSFDAHPSKYRHWTLAVDGEVARLAMEVTPFGGGSREVELKSNSYDLRLHIELADAFSTLAEGVKGKRAVEWGLVDAVVPRSKFADTIAQRARDLAAKAPAVERGPGIELDPIGDSYRHVELKIDDGSRIAELTVRAPQGEVPKTAAEALAKGAQG